MNINAYILASRFVGKVLERPGDLDHPLIQWWLSLCRFGFDAHDETPWCSAFVNGIAFELGVPRTESALARSWLQVGRPVSLDEAEVGWDIVILQRGSGPQPGPEVIAAPGHVGFFAGHSWGSEILVLGGNQSNAVNVRSYPRARVLGVRRLYTEPKTVQEDFPCAPPSPP